MKGMKKLKLLVQQLRQSRYGGDGRSLSGHICFLVFISFLSAFALLRLGVRPFLSLAES